MNDRKALEVAERCLEHLNRAVLAREFDDFAQVIALPYEVQCFDGALMCHDRAALEAMFRRVGIYYCRHAITELIRLPREASFTAPDRVQCLYETRALTAQRLLAEEPFFCLTEIVRQSGQWRMQRSQYDIIPSDLRHGVIFGTVPRAAGAAAGTGAGMR